jgi:hypothetical protein
MCAVCMFGKEWRVKTMEGRRWNVEGGAKVMV